MKNVIITVLVIVVIIFGLSFLFSDSPTKVDTYQNKPVATSTDETQPPTTETPEENPVANPNPVIGKSVEGRDITAYTYGSGDKEILFVGGIHGAYGWNTVLLAYEAIDYFKANPEVIPSNLKITIIPVMNPDGLYKVIGSSARFDLKDVPSKEADTIVGRFNANTVDLNRNFDCDWKTTGTWQNKTVSGGSEVFSEPEAQAIKNYIEKEDPHAVVVWYSSAGGVYSSSCNDGILPETKSLTNTYAKASGYKSYEEFDSYAINGDMVNWLASKNIPAISVLLATHNKTEWLENKAGIEALLKYYQE